MRLILTISIFLIPENVTTFLCCANIKDAKEKEESERRWPTQLSLDRKQRKPSATAVFNITFNQLRSCVISYIILSNEQEHSNMLLYKYVSYASTSFTAFTSYFNGKAALSVFTCAVIYYFLLHCLLF